MRQTFKIGDQVEVKDKGLARCILDIVELDEAKSLLDAAFKNQRVGRIRQVDHDPCAPYAEAEYEVQLGARRYWFLCDELKEVKRNDED
jgi:hypothetical protein